MSQRDYRINDRIRLSPVRVVGADGAQIGIMNTDAALQMASDADLDLVEMGPDERPPICKIMDYGKFRYEQGKKEKSQRKNAARNETKEVRLRPNTDTADLDRLTEKAREFLRKGHQTQITMMLRGRQIAKTGDAVATMRGIAEKLVENGKLDKPPALNGRRIIMILCPQRV